MRIERVHTVILGAGPAGLTAGHILASAGHRPVILEQNSECGGLMRSIKRGDFIVDIGRKGLYNAIPRVDEFWKTLLGDQYRVYEHRGGVLFDGRILDMSASFQGFRRGMAWSTFIQCVWDYFSVHLRVARKRPSNVEELFHSTRGRSVSRIFAQGFQEKISGRKWADISLQPKQVGGARDGFLHLTKEGLMRTFSSKDPNMSAPVWRHPAKGTGQICSLLEESIRSNGGRILCEANVIGIKSAGDNVVSVTTRLGPDTITFHIDHLVSSIPLNVLTNLVLNTAQETSGKAPTPKRTVVLVYLFLTHPIEFPHTWLNVTCPTTRIGRISNYAALQGEMVPKGKGALCIEYYCFGKDELLELPDDEITGMTIADLARFRIIAPAKCFDHFVLRLPGADASQNRHNWLNSIRTKSFADLKTFRNLYYVSRTDLDVATLAGMESAEAIIRGDRTEFDSHIDPAVLGGFGKKKAFEFKYPEEPRSDIA